MARDVPSRLNDRPGADRAHSHTRKKRREEEEILRADDDLFHGNVKQ